MTRTSLLARIGTILALSSLAGTVHAAGTIDPGFGTNGTDRIGGVGGYGPTTLVVHPGGRIVYAASRPDFGDVVVGSLDADGIADDGFAFGGLIPIGVSGGSVSSPLLAFDPVSGASVLAATALQGGIYHLMLCRILDDGTLDHSFNLLNYPDQTGCIVTNPPVDAPNGLDAAGITVNRDGVISIGGTAYDFAHTPLFKAFYSVVQSGFVDVATEVLTVAANNVTITGFDDSEASDYAVLTGSIQLPDADENVDTAILAIRANLTLGWSYAIIDPNLVPLGYDEGRAIAIRPDGKILIAGVVDQTSPDFTDCAIYQLNPDLTLDTSFGDAGNGGIVTNFSGGFGDGASCDAIAIDGDDAFVGGMLRINNDSDRDMAVAKLSPNGTFDPAFGTIAPGVSVFGPGDTAQTTVYERVLAIGVQNGRVIAAGPLEPTSGATASNSEMLIVRLADENFIFASGFD